MLKISYQNDNIFFGFYKFSFFGKIIFFLINFLWLTCWPTFKINCSEKKLNDCFFSIFIIFFRWINYKWKLQKIMIIIKIKLTFHCILYILWIYFECNKNWEKSLETVSDLTLVGFTRKWTNAKSKRVTSNRVDTLKLNSHCQWLRGDSLK